MPETLQSSSSPLAADDDSSTSSENPDFMESFGFYLAVHLLGDQVVSKAMQDNYDSSNEIVLSWRSPFQEESGIGALPMDHVRCKVGTPTTTHIFFVDVTFTFTTCGTNRNRTLQTKFGTLMRVPIKRKENYSNADYVNVYAQSSSWNLSDLQTYAIGTGICVEETGPRGMAETVASSLRNLQKPQLKTCNLDKVSNTDDDIPDQRFKDKFSVSVDIFHTELMERVTLIRATQTFSEAFVGTTALSTWKLSLKDNHTETATTERNSISTGGCSVDTIQSFKSWRILPNLGHREQNTDERIQTQSHDNAQSFQANHMASHTSSACVLSNEEDLRAHGNKKWNNEKIETNRNSDNQALERMQSHLHASAKVHEMVDSKVANTTKATTMPVKDDTSTATLASTKPSIRRPKIVHGATRTKKRKKGKMRFAKA